MKYRRRRLRSSCRIGWNNRNYDGRKQRHFSYWRWFSSVLGPTNVQKIIHKNYFILGQFVWYVHIFRPIFQLPSPCTYLCAFLITSPPFPQLRTYLMDDLFLNQKTNKTIPISYSLIYKHSKKHKFFKSNTFPKILHLISVTLSHINSIVIAHFKS